MYSNLMKLMTSHICAADCTCVTRGVRSAFHFEEELATVCRLQGTAPGDVLLLRRSVVEMEQNCEE